MSNPYEAGVTPLRAVIIAGGLVGVSLTLGYLIFWGLVGVLGT